MCFSFNSYYWFIIRTTYVPLHGYNNSYNYNCLSDTTIRNRNCFVHTQLVIRLLELQLIDLIAQFIPFIVQHIQPNEHSRDENCLFTPLEQSFVSICIWAFSYMSFHHYWLGVRYIYQCIFVYTQPLFAYIAFALFFYLILTLILLLLLLINSSMCQCGFCLILFLTIFQPS